MQTKNKKQIISTLLTVVIPLFVVCVGVYAATTIGTNISTTGTTSMTTASTTDDFWLGNQTADDDDYLYMDASSSEYIMWDDSPGNFALSDDLSVGFDSAADNDVIYFDANGENLTWNNTSDLFTLSDDLFLSGYASATAAIFGGYTTTTNMWIGASQPTANATTTVVFGDSISTNSSVCFKVRTTANEWVYAYATSSQSMIATGFKWTSTSCE